MPQDDPLSLTLIHPGVEIESDLKVWRTDGNGRTLLGTIAQRIHRDANVQWNARRPFPGAQDAETQSFATSAAAIGWIRSAPWADPADPTARVLLMSGHFHRVLERLPGGGLICASTRIVDNKWQSVDPLPIAWRHGAGQTGGIRRTAKGWAVVPPHGRTKYFASFAGAFTALGDLGLPPDASAHMRMQRRAQKAGPEHRALVARLAANDGVDPAATDAPGE